jgi:hypothetical protein
MCSLWTDKGKSVSSGAYRLAAVLTWVLFGKLAFLQVVLLGVTAHQVTCRFLLIDLYKIPWNAPYVCTSGIQVVALVVSLVPSSIISCPAQFFERPDFTLFYHDFKCWLFLWLRDIPRVLELFVFLHPAVLGRMLSGFGRVHWVR